MAVFGGLVVQMNVLSIFIWLYAAIILIWFMLYRQRGDSIWWLALVNSFAPLLFAPLLLFLLLGIISPSIVLWVGMTIPIAIFLYLYGILFCPKRHFTTNIGDMGAQEGHEVASFTIMTFNIWCFSWQEETARVLEQNGWPDIVAIQELDLPMAAKIVDACGDHYPHRLLPTRSETKMLGIFSRYPLTLVDASPIATRDFRLQRVRVAAPGGDFLLHNIHPRATDVMRYKREGRPIVRTTERSFKMRTSSIECLLADIAARGEATVLVGDFNSSAQSDVYKRMAAQLTDTHRTVGWGFGHTFPAYRQDMGGIPIPPRQLRLDMIFYSPELMALQCRVGQFHGESDHLPVIATLAWRAVAPQSEPDNQVTSHEIRHEPLAHQPFSLS